MSRESGTATTAPLATSSSGRCRPAPIPLSLAAAGCGLLYALYRGYYGFGGSVALIGTVRSATEWRTINLTAAGVLLVAAALPLAALPLWRRRGPRRVLLVLAWVVAVGCVMHACVDDVQRVLSLTGVRQVAYPSSLWATVDRHAADVQDLAFNETWFLAEGMLWGLLGWAALDRSPRRRWWVGSGVVAVGVLTAIGMLSTFGVIGRFVIG
jgi:hypothetical protein